MISSSFLVLSALIPILYVWLLPFLQTSGILTTTGSWSVSSLIEDATGTGGFAASMFLALFLIVFKSLQDNTWVASLLTYTFLVGFALFLTIPSNRVHRAHITAVTVWISAIFIRFLMITRTTDRKDLRALLGISLVVFVFAAIVHYRNFLKRLKHRIVWAAESCALTCLVLFLPLFYYFQPIEI